MEDAITGVDVGQEGISQALASMSTFHQTSNVNNIKKSWDFAATKREKKKKRKQSDNSDENGNIFLCFSPIQFNMKYAQVNRSQ